MVTISVQMGLMKTTVVSCCLFFSAMNIYKMNMHHACLSTLVSVMQTDCCKMACMELTIDNIGYCA